MTVAVQEEKKGGIRLDPDKDVMFAFPTPIVNTNIGGTDALNDGLRRIIMERRAQDRGMVKSNAGGWHSSTDLFRWEHPEIQTLRTLVNVMVCQIVKLTASKDCQWNEEVSYDAWANVNGNGDYNKTHNHPGAHWSGVYYVDMGEPNDPEGPDGSIDFQDPRGFLSMLPHPGKQFGPSLDIKPCAGKVLIFPSFIFHTVAPHYGKKERISVAFNAMLGNQ